MVIGNNICRGTMETKKCNLCKKELDIKKFEKAKINNGEVTISVVNKCIDCREKERRNYLLLKDNNYCPLCKSPSETSICCENCKLILRENRKQKVILAKEQGLCNYCYKRPIETGNSCHLCLYKRKEQSIISRLYTRAKSRAKKIGREFNIKTSDITLPEYCPILHIKLQLNANHCEDNSYSLDRIDSSKGYIKDNIQVISHRANQLKNNATVEELEIILNYLKNIGA